MSTIERIKKRHSFTPKGDGFDAVRGQVRYLQDRYHSECEYFDFHIKDALSDEWRLRELRHQKAKVLDYIATDIIEMKTRLPPYTTLHADGYFIRHPVVSQFEIGFLPLRERANPGPDLTVKAGLGD